MARAEVESSIKHEFSVFSLLLVRRGKGARRTEGKKKEKEKEKERESSRNYDQRTGRVYL